MTYEEAKAKIRQYGIYRHFKGDCYEVFAVVKHSETGEPLVVYRNVNEADLTLARPADMWFDDVGKGVRRFELYQPEKENGNV